MMLVDRTADPVAVDEYIALEARGYKGAQGIAMTAVPGEPEYFADMCRRFAAAGRLRLLALQAGDQLLAMEIWVRGGQGLFMFKISYDDHYARFGPGVILQTEAKQVFHDETDAQWIDTCSSEGNESLLRLYPERRRIEMLAVILGKSVVDRAVVALFEAARPLHKRWYELRRRSTSHLIKSISHLSNKGRTNPANPNDTAVRVRIEQRDARPSSEVSNPRGSVNPLAPRCSWLPAHGTAEGVRSA